MAHKTPQQTNILIHLATWTLGTPLALVAAGAGLFAALGAPSGETLTVATLMAILGVIIGFPLGLVSFFVVRGMRGWREYFAARRADQVAESEAALIAQVEQNLADHFSSTGVLDDVRSGQLTAEPDKAADPWNGTNPYGCCQDNYDADGNLSHGSPDCLHPLVLEQRQAS